MIIIKKIIRKRWPIKVTIIEKVTATGNIINLTNPQQKAIVISPTNSAVQFTNIMRINTAEETALRGFPRDTDNACLAITAEPG